jgi:transcriptional regulator with XRE-family HTH domain
MQSVGAVIRRRRTQMRLLQTKVAEDSDIDRVFYGLLERGRKNASVETLEKIVRVLGVRLSRVIAEAEKEMDS